MPRAGRARLTSAFAALLLARGACLRLDLPPAAAPVRPASSAAERLRPPPPAAAPPPPPTALDVASFGAFRSQLRQQSGCRDAAPGFDGMLAELRQYQRTHTPAEQADCSGRIMGALGGPLPAAFRALAARRSWAPAALAFFTTLFLPFLVGPMTLTQRQHGDGRAGGVLVQRCRVLEESGCKGLCTHMCKLPTERMFAERWGLPLHMAPNFETYECQLSFGVEPPPVESDPSLPRGCLSGCPLADPGVSACDVEAAGSTQK